MSVELTLDRVTGDIHVEGEVDASCEADFWGGLFALAEPSACVTVDLRDCTFMDSTGLHALIGLARSGRSVTVIGARDGAKRLFQVAGVERLVPTLHVISNGSHDARNGYERGDGA